MAETAQRAALKSHQVFGTNDSTKLSKYKQVAEEARALGGWDAFDLRMKAERDRWEAQGSSPTSPKQRAFRWAEIVSFVGKLARERKASAGGSTVVE